MCASLLKNLKNRFKNNPGKIRRPWWQGLVIYVLSSVQIRTFELTGGWRMFTGRNCSKSRAAEVERNTCGQSTVRGGTKPCWSSPRNRFIGSGSWTSAHPPADTEVAPSPAGVTATLPRPLVMFSKPAEDFLLTTPSPPARHGRGLWRHAVCVRPAGTNAYGNTVPQCALVVK